jgi:hypothetical protein
MLKTKKGYWLGKKRDEKTLKALSESKFKKVIQYNTKGELVKIWSNSFNLKLFIYLYIKNYVEFKEIN